MRTTTTILSATGLALIGATLFAPAAHAAETPAPSAAIQTDRLIGQLQIDSRIWGDMGQPENGIASGLAHTWTLPAKGTSGPVMDADTGRCLVVQALNAPTKMADCSVGDPAQIWHLDEVNRLVSDQRPDSYLGTGGSTQYMYIKTYSSANPVDLGAFNPGPGDGDGGDDEVNAPSVSDIDNTSGSTVISGAGIPGATIEIRNEAGDVIATGTVDENSTWSIDLGKDMSETPENLDVVQKIDDRESAPVRIDAANLPIIAPAIAAGAGVLALAGIGGTIIRRRRNA